MPNPHAAALGRLGGAARALALTPARRLAIAKKASKAAKLARCKKGFDLSGKAIG